ncbi:MAG: HAMP domain-containing protein [Ardenticatenaceae bacterium]|nr:HAMP domain-containing protein [Anaerolineales bacterium]MCB8917066.1 HAMP domain-containing protein [Ardenticatenaceae bacterium]
MSIRDRLIFIYTTILVGAFVLFGIVVYFLPRVTLLGEIDARLKETSQQMLDDTLVFSRQDVLSLVISQEQSVFEKANTFTMVVGTKGEILVRSENLTGFEGVLDPAGIGTTTEVFRTTTVDEQDIRVLTVPLYVESGRQDRLLGYLQVAEVVDDYSAFERLLVISLLIGAAAVTFSLFLVTWLTPSLFKPLEDIAAVARQITRADDLSRRVPDTGRQDEIGDLTLALNQTLERLENLFRTQQRFLADVSHELRTPLTTIRGNVDLLRRMGMADPDFLDDIQAELERMTRLVNDLLLLARADVGSMPIMREPIDVDTLLVDVYRQVAMLTPPVTMKLGEVDQARVLGDRDRLRQLFLNLLDNAIKYTPAGGTVRLSLSKTAERVEVVVSDTGVGIPEQDLPHIFDRFYRVDKARTRMMGGSGLGLSIVKSIVEAHGGDIHVTSEVGKGTTFYVSLPLLLTEAERSANGAAAATSTGPLGSRRGRGSKTATP